LITQPYIEKRWNEEFYGISDGAGVDVWDIRRLNYVPELLKASCSDIGAWGKATATG